MDIPIIYEDDELIVINKPPGIVVNRAESVKGETVQDWAEKHISSSFWQASQRVRPESDPGVATLPRMTMQDDFITRSGIVHRIDKETSGLLLVAKTPFAFHELQRQFKERIVKKTYVALVHGKLVPETGEIRAPIGRLPWNRERFGIVPGGKEAVTKYRVQRYYSSSDPDSIGRVEKSQGNSSRLRSNNNDLSLVELYPETGRTHQIRVHLKYINHPILGDYLYAGRVVSRDDREWVPRVMLHAARISFMHPTTKNPVEFIAPMPDDMLKITEQTRK